MTGRKAGTDWRSRSAMVLRPSVERVFIEAVALAVIADGEPAGVLPVDVSTPHLLTFDAGFGSRHGGSPIRKLTRLPRSASTQFTGRILHIVREDGDLLHPARQGKESVEREKTALGSYAFAGQYQQRPAPAEGGMVKAAWFKRYAEPQHTYDRIVQSWDTAIKSGQLNDPSCCTTWGVRPDGYDLLQVDLKRLEYPDLKRRVISQAHAFGA